MAKSQVKIINTPDEAIEEIERLNAQFGKGENRVKVGLPRGSNNYPDGTSVIMVGAVHEFGSPSRNIPSRSYLRSTLVKERAKYKSLFKKMAKQIVKGKMTEKQALNLLGLSLQKDVRERITEINMPPLKSPRSTSPTSETQGRLPDANPNPLVDTGHLRLAITFQVEE